VSTERNNLGHVRKLFSGYLHKLLRIVYANSLELIYYGDSLTLLSLVVEMTFT
jgi:hypothetical protein